CYLEIAGAIPEEPARIAFPGGETMNVHVGAGASGQGHRTVFGAVAARKLGLAPEQVNVLSGDSARDVPGFGAVASRSAVMVGGAVANTADALIAKGKRVAAMLLQAEEAEVAYAAGKFRVKNREVSLFDVAARAAELKESLDTQGGIKAPPSFPRASRATLVPYTTLFARMTSPFTL